MNQAFSGHLKKFFAGLGPGMITGAADDDPSGISTYSIAGASFGYGPLWTALVSLPMMIAVQLMCARLGLVTGRGLASVIRTRYPPIVLWVCCALLVGANIVNIGADLAGMADATELITGVPSQWCTPVYALLILGLMIWSTYPTIARIFKWFTLALLAYILAAFLARPDFRAVVEFTFLPTIQWSSAYLATLVAIFGTTISPYLFFWQSAQEVEELHSHNETTRRDSDALRSAQTDVLSGMFFSNLVMYFIILTAAATLYVNGHRDISSSKEAAEALRPLAGAGAYYLFTIGLVGAGMLGVPVLAGSSAYAIAEAANWRGSLDERPRTAHGFYAVLVLAVLLGLGMDFAGFDAIKMLFWAAVINGVVAPPLIFVIVLLTRDPRVMDAHINPRWLSLLGWATVAFMTIAVLAMLSGAWGLI